MNIKKIVNDVVKITGYQFTKTPTVENEIKKGNYRWLQNFGIKTVIDVGANNGGFATMIYKIIPDSNIYSFEPILSCVEELKANTKNVKNIKIFNCALGNEKNELTFYHNEFAPSSSLLKMNRKHIESFPYTAQTREEKVNVFPLDFFINELSLARKILLKIDVQGYELNVLSGAEEILKMVDIIILEVSFFELYEKQPLFDSIYEFLLCRGFKYFGNLSQLSDPSDGSVIQADAIFIQQGII